MTVVISAARLSAMQSAGVQNNPHVGIDSLYRRAGSHTAGSATAARIADGLTYTWWTPGGSYPVQNTYALTSGTAAINMAAIASHNLGTIGKRITPQGWNGSTWDNLGAAQDPTTNETIIWLFADYTASQFRFNVADPAATGGQAYIGVGFFGRSVQLGSRFYQGFDEARHGLPTDVELLANSTGAHVLGTSIVNRGARGQWQLEYVPEATAFGADQRTFYADFNAGRGFFGAWRPAESQTAHYMWRDGDPVRIVNAGPNTRKALTLNMRVWNE